MYDSLYSEDFLSLKRLVGDEWVQLFISKRLADQDSSRKFYSWLAKLRSNKDLQFVPEEFEITNFVSASRMLPAWGDRTKLLKGSVFFIRHSETIMSLLGLLSLPYCYAAADGAMVLYLTEHLRDRPAKRLSDTADFIWDVMAPDAFEDKGRGFASCFKIRMTHALARHYVGKSDSWDARLGVPVNQEDMAGTNLAFSLIVIRGLRMLGLAVSYEEQQSFMHLWNVIGYLLGLQDCLIPQDGKSATMLDSMIRKRHFKPSIQGKTLTKALLDHITTAPSVRLSPREIYQIMRFLLGDDVADMLEVPYVSGAEYAPIILKVAAHLPRLDSGNAHLAYLERHTAFLKTRTSSGV